MILQYSKIPIKIQILHNMPSKYNWFIKNLYTISNETIICPLIVLSKSLFASTCHQFHPLFIKQMAGSKKQGGLKGFIARASASGKEGERRKYLVANLPSPTPTPRLLPSQLSPPTKPLRVYITSPPPPSVLCCEQIWLDRCPLHGKELFCAVHDSSDCVPSFNYWNSAWTGGY